MEYNIYANADLLSKSAASPANVEDHEKEREQQYEKQESASTRD